MKRQNIRKLFIISAMLLFPITIFYFSPYLIIQGALEGVMTGSFLVFTGMLITSIFFGRLFCAYLCPAGGVQECATLVTTKSPKQGWKNYIKYVIWTVWIFAIILCFFNRSKEISVNFFYMTDHGISIANIYAYIIYYGIILLIVIPALVGGKRTFCHYFCWMAPFMVIGSKLGQILHIKQLRLTPEKEKCISCHACDKACPMSLKVNKMVLEERMDDTECILCGACIDTCPKKAIRYQMK